MITLLICSYIAVSIYFINDALKTVMEIIEMSTQDPPLIQKIKMCIAAIFAGIFWPVSLIMELYFYLKERK